MNVVLILVGKIISLISNALNLGHGSTWPGHIAFETNKNFIKDVLSKNKNLKIILIAGTNGKTTTGKLIQTIFEHQGYKVFQNEAGANLVNGIASSIALHSNILCKINYDYAVFEVDENSLPLVLNELKPDYLVLLNLFRDQLDRYGEVNTIASKWKNAISMLPSLTTIILNADDPQIAYLGSPLSHPHVYYFGLDDKSLGQKTHQHAVDSTYCPNCGNKLTYQTVYFSHLGDYKCSKCSFARGPLDGKSSPFYPLSGVYNRYNTNAAVLVAKLNSVSVKTIEQSMKSFSPAFGRQEILEVNSKRTQIFLSKNPTSFNESLRTVIEQKARNILIILNDQIPDGHDVSWIWDVDFEQIDPNINITVSGDRVYDMALRLKYTEYKILNTKYNIEENLKKAIQIAINKSQKVEILYILPTYSAMLEVRKILTGRRIL